MPFRLQTGHVPDDDVFFFLNIFIKNSPRDAQYRKGKKTVSARLSGPRTAYEMRSVLPKGLEKHTKTDVCVLVYFTAHYTFTYILVLRIL